MSEINHELWAELYTPIPNPYRFGTGFDFGNGSTLLSLVDFQEYQKENPVHPDHQWSLIADSSGEYITQGAHWINTKGYFITKHKPLFPIREDILLAP